MSNVKPFRTNKALSTIPQTDYSSRPKPSDLAFGRFKVAVRELGYEWNEQIEAQDFRRYWGKTRHLKKDELARFAFIASVLAGEAHMPVTKFLRRADQPKPKAKSVLLDRAMEKFGDGEKRSAKLIADKLAVSEATIVALFKSEYHDECYVEQQLVQGSGWFFALYPAELRRVNIAIDELRKELSPVLKDLYSEGEKDRLQATPANVFSLTRRIEKILNALAK